ncbi:hypothetical protein [Gaetbulibacter aestuarii]|uniref:Uncharacterized protein n=1 Tax=Gaetbulibacter aestuarii TaxID=1502358 RepID=A0ABW7N1H7_9FLAO
MNTNSKVLLETNLKNRYNQTYQWIKAIKQFEQELVHLRKIIENRIHTKCDSDCDHKTIYRNIDTVLYQVSEDLIFDLVKHAKTINTVIYAQVFLNVEDLNLRHIHLFEKMELLHNSIENLRVSIMKFIEDRPYEFEEFKDLNLKLDL